MHGDWAWGRWLKADESCIGRYCTQEQATTVAADETVRTGKQHMAHLAMYNCPFSKETVFYWGVVVNKRSSNNG